MKNPDKYIRQYFYSTLNNIEVDDNTIKVYDYRVPQNDDFYILMVNQSSEKVQDTKCDTLAYDCRITLDIVTRFQGKNAGSRLLADNIKEKVMNLTQNITIQNFELSNLNISYPDDLYLITDTQNIFRKLIIYEFKLNQNG